MPDRVRSVTSYEDLPRPLSPEHPTTEPDAPAAEQPAPAEAPAPPAEKAAPEPAAAEPSTPPSPNDTATLTLKVGNRVVFQQSGIVDFTGVIEVADKGIMVIPSPNFPWWAWAIAQMNFELTNRIAGARLAALKKQQQRGIVMASDIPKNLRGG